MWINVDDMLPTACVECLVTDGEDYAVGSWRPDAKAWDSYRFGWIEKQDDPDWPHGLKKVTHWMRLPDLPKEQ